MHSTHEFIRRFLLQLTFSRPFLAKDASGEKIAPTLVPPYALQMTWLPLHSYGLQLSLPTFEAAQRQRDSKKSVLYPVVASNLPYICVPIPQYALQMEWLRLLLPTFEGTQRQRDPKNSVL